MLYSISINQKQAVALGISNVNQVFILDLIAKSPSWAKAVSVGDEVYYWLSRNQIVEQLPLLGIKPDTAYRHLKSLAENGFIEYLKQGKKDLVRLTDKGKSYFTKSEINPNSEIDPSKLGNESEKNSEMNPTNKYYNINKNNKDNNALSRFGEFWSLYDKKSDKAKVQKKWKRLTKKQKDKIFEVLPNYIKQTPDKQYRKNPLTWLNGECWDDEDIQPKQSPEVAQGLSLTDWEAKAFKVGIGRYEGKHVETVEQYIERVKGKLND